MKRLITIGKIVKPVGLKGHIKALSFMESPRTIEGQRSILVGPDDDSATPHRISSVTTKGRTLLFSLAGIDSVEAADRLRGHYLFLSRDTLPPLDDDEFYWADIIGLPVVTTEGKRLGVVSAILPTGSNDVYVCKGDDGELLLPALDDVILAIDLRKGVIIADPPREDSASGEDDAL